MHLGEGKLNIRSTAVGGRIVRRVRYWELLRSVILWRLPACWSGGFLEIQKLVETKYLGAFPDLERVAPAGTLHHFPSPDCRGPVEVALWLPHQDGVSPEGGHAVLYEQAPDAVMDIRGQHGAPLSLC